MADATAAPTTAAVAASTPTPTPAAAGGILLGSQEADIIHSLYKPNIGENETWAILDAKWYHSWARYSGFGEEKKEVAGVRVETGAPRPGPVDNSRLVSPNYPAMLKTELGEGLDYVLVHILVWNKYIEWYSGGPAFVRGTLAQGIRKVIRVEMYPIFLELLETKGEAADESSVKIQSFSQRLCVREIIATLTPPVTATADVAPTTTAAETPAVTAPGGPAVVDAKDAKEEKKEKEPPIRVWFEEPQEEKKTDALSLDAPATSSTAIVVAAGTDPLTAVAVVPAAEGAAAATTTTPAAATTEGAAAPAVAAAPAAPKRKKDSWRLIEGEATLGTPLEALGIGKDKPIKVLVERQAADGSWPRAAYVKDWRDFEIGDTIDVQDTVGKWYESNVRDIKTDSIHTHFIGWAESWDEWIPRSSPRLAKKNTHTTGPRVKPVETGWSGMSWSYGNSEDGRPSVPGAVGLRNLGNTCFMNSTLACLGHSPVLTDFFLDDRYLAEINRDNPLGWKGEVALQYGAMTKDVWCDKYTTVAPKKFKEAIGQFAPRFSGYQQQDSSELLSFLLDGLHEDLNRIIKKPSTPTIESKGRPDAEVADESWASYRRRNDSMIVDTMQGQLKSRLQCPVPTCNRISITFDPFTFLSAPLPTIVDKIQEVALVSATPGRPITIYGCTVSTVGRMADLKKALSEISGVPQRRLVMAELWNHRIYRFMEDDTGLSEIRPNDHIYAYEVPQMDELKGEGVPVQIIHQRLEKNPSYDPAWAHSREFTAEAFGLPRVFALPRRSTLSSHAIRAIIDTAVAPSKPTGGETPFKILALQNDARNCLKCGFTSLCTGCDAPDEEAAFDIGESRDSKVAFALQWTGTGAAYNKESEVIVRDRTADVALTKKESHIDIGDCLRSFTKQETLSEADPWYCSDCKDFRQAYKKFDIWRLPQLLVIHMKRFSYTRLWRDKISTFVDFPVNGLDMSHFCPNPEYKGDKGLYDLYGVSNHMGNMGGGHYTAYVRNMSNDKWYCHDDSRVYPVNESEIKSSSAYVLFYRRRDLPRSRRFTGAGAAAAATTAAPTTGTTTPATTTEGAATATATATPAPAAAAAPTSSSSSSSTAATTPAAAPSTPAAAPAS